MKIKGKLGKVLLPLLLVTIFVVLPSVSLGALWVQNVALLPGTAVVFSSDAAAMDRFMASALKPYYGDRIGVCDGANDHVEIQAALDAVRDVKLSPGQFNCEVAIDIDNSNQTLRGCGRNTILTTTTADLNIITITGSAGSEKVGVTVADLTVDGNSVGGVYGICLEFADYSFIRNIQATASVHGITLNNSDGNIVSGSICEGNNYGIMLESSTDNVVSGNNCLGNLSQGITLTAASYNIINGNACCGNTGDGILLTVAATHNVIIGNSCCTNGEMGIYIYSSSHNTISGNICCENSQSVDATYSDIKLATSADYNNIQANTCRAGGLANVPRYGISIVDATCDGNLVTNNDIYDDGFGTGSLNDVGTGTVTVAGNRV